MGKLTFVHVPAGSHPVYEERCRGRALQCSRARGSTHRPRSGLAISVQSFICIESLGEDVSFRDRTRRLLDLKRFGKALALVQSPSHWRRDVEALRQCGRIARELAAIVPESAGLYRTARAYFQLAVARASAQSRARANCHADIAMTHLSEGNLDHAERHYTRALEADSRAYVALLGGVAVACAKRDPGLVAVRCERLVRAIGNWYENPHLVAILASEDRLAFLREEPGLFASVFGGNPKDLYALHRKHRMMSLMRGIDERLADDDLADDAGPRGREDVATLRARLRAGLRDAQREYTCRAADD